VAVPPLVSDAYPTTFQRPATPYHASSIADGRAVFTRHCAVCHGERGAGDGPAAASLNPRPPDLRVAAVRCLIELRGRCGCGPGIDSRRLHSLARFSRVTRRSAGSMPAGAQARAQSDDDLTA